MTGVEHVHIKLSGKSSKSEKKFYEEISSKLKLFDTFNLIIRWEPFDDNICPSSVAKYFSERGVRVEACNPQLAIKRQGVPSIPTPSVETTDCESLVEWMGMVVIGGDLTPEDPFISTYKNIAKSSDSGFITAYHISGLFSSHFVIKLRKLLSEINIKRDICEWIGLTVQTFTDIPNLPRINKRRSCLPQDNILTFVMGENNFVHQCYRSY